MTKPLKVLDCFSGIGGFALAESFFEGQFETKQFVEINPYCQQVLSKNFKGVPIHDDIKNFTAPKGSFDLCTFGFPCQDISVGGQQKGIGEGTRSGLFYECIRLLREIRPQFAIFENVRNLLSIKEGKVFQEVLFQIAQAGYDAEWSVVSARDVGGCHLRERVWIIAYPKHNGSSTPKRLRFDDKANSSSQKRKNSAIKSERSYESTDSKTIQRTTATQTTNTNIKGLEGLRGEHELQESCGEEKARWSTQPYTLEPDWRRYDSKPMLGRRTDGVPSRMDANWRNRKERIICLGNAVTPQQAAIPLGRIIDLIKS
jgi:DNA (cytosine-5)-methyltransferase 1